MPKKILLFLAIPGLLVALALGVVFYLSAAGERAEQARTAAELAARKNMDPLDRDDVLWGGFAEEPGRRDVEYGRILCNVFKGNIFGMHGMYNNLLATVAFSGALSRYEFVPSMLLPPEKEKMTYEERKEDSDILKKQLTSFWIPWIIRLYDGSEAAYYRELARNDYGRYKNDPDYYTETKALFKQACDMGDAEACYLYAAPRVYDSGRLLLKEHVTKEDWAYLRKAAKLGYVPAYEIYGVAHVFGVMEKKDPALGAEYLNKALDGGSLGAAEALRYYYFNGFGVPKDYRQGYYYLFIAGSVGSDLVSMVKDIPDEQEREELISSARARRKLVLAKAADTSEQERLKARWLEMVPEIKAAIHRDLPWLVWVMVPDAEKKAAREEYLKSLEKEQS